MNLPSLKAAYISWTLLILSSLGYSLITGEYQSRMSLAVDKTGQLPDGMSHHDMLVSFIAISLGYAFILILAAGILVWLASKNKKWAVWALTFFAAWQAYDATFTNLKINQMYPGMINWSDWLLGVLCSIIWIYIIVSLHKFKKGHESDVSAA